MGKDRKPLGTVAMVALAAILLSAVALAVDVDAARGGKGGGKPAPPPTATLTVSPNPVPAGGYTYVVSGTGFTPDRSVNFVLGGLVHYAFADSNGNAATSFQSGYPGTVTVIAKQMVGRSWETVGSVTFEVT